MSTVVRMVRLARQAPAAALIPLLALLLLGPAAPGPGLPAGPPPDVPRDAPIDPAAAAAQGVPGVPPAIPPSPAPSPAPPSGPPPVVLTGSGWGHSVGLSQYGARAMALAGHGYPRIIGQYFRDVRLGTLKRAPNAIRVNLFSDRTVDASRLLVQTASRDGRAPSRPVTVRLGAAAPVAVPFGQTWELRPDGAGLALRDGAGVVRARGGVPARIEFQFLPGRPTLLRLAQVAASYQWGVLEVRPVGGRLQPVLVLPLESYLRGIAEMPSDWPLEALKAQALAARTYAVRQVARGVQPGCDCHLGATPLHQAYAGWAKEAGQHGHRWVVAVRGTAGQVVSYRGQLAWTYFSSSHGGHTENSEQSWAFPNPVPYLRAVPDPWSTRPEAGNPYTRWRRAIPNARFARALGLGLVEVHRVRVLSRTPGGTPLELEVVGRDRGGVERVHRWRGPRRGIAGADLKLLFRKELPSQQISAIEVGPLG